MKSVVIILSLCVASTLGSTADWSGLSVKFGATSLFKNKLWFFDAPSYIGQEVASGDWKNTTIDNLYNLQALSFKVDYDYGFNPLYDQNGFLAGVHTCQPMATIKESGPPTYDPVSRGTVEVKTIGDVDHYCSSFLIVSPETLNAGGRTELGSSIGEGLWLRDTANTDTGYTQVSDEIDEMLEQTEFKWERCIAKMGTHYFWNTTETMVCETFYNWFLIGDRTTNSIHGLGFQLYGKNTHYYNDFYDYIPRLVAKYTVPIASDCFYDWAGDYGVSSLHIYFKSNPEDIACASGDSVTDSK